MGWGKREENSKMLKKRGGKKGKVGVNGEADLWVRMGKGSVR